MRVAELAGVLLVLVACMFVWGVICVVVADKVPDAVVLLMPDGVAVLVAELVWVVVCVFSGEIDDVVVAACAVVVVAIGVREDEALVVPEEVGAHVPVATAMDARVVRNCAPLVEADVALAVVVLIVCDVIALTETNEVGVLT